MKTYKVFDLRKMARELGGHFDGPDEIAWCDCGSQVTQTMERCPGCGINVVWKNSPTWQEQYEHANQRIKRFLYTPQDEAGQYLMQRAGQQSFYNRQEMQRWHQVTDRLGPEDLKGVVDYCARKTSGRGLVKYTLNAAEKQASSLPAAEDGEWEIIG